MAGRANSGHSEVDYAHLFELSSIMFCVADFSGRIVNINHAWESQLGYRVEDLVGVEYLALVHPDDMEATRGLIRQLNGAGSVAGFINRYRSAAGEYRHIEWQATVAGELIYASAVDVTQRERAIIALRRSEARHRRLFEVTTQGVIYEDANGRILDANPAAQEILGMTMEQLSGRTSLDAKWRAIHEDGSAFPGPEHPAMIALATGREVRDVTMGVFNAEQDRYRWVRIRAIPELDPGTGQVQDVSVTFDDISAALSDRAQIEAQNASLREAMAEQTEYRAQLDSMMAAVNRHAIVSVTDLDGRITAFNDNFTKISQYSADELLGNTPSGDQLRAPSQGVLHRHVGNHQGRPHLAG